MSLKLIDNILLTSNHHQRSFTADIRYMENSIAKPIILFVHGFKGFKDWGHFNLIASQLAEAGFVVVKFNFSHNGTTPASPHDFADLEAFSENNFTIELDDLNLVIDRLLEGSLPLPAKEVDTNQLYLIGHSRGGGIALIHTGDDIRVKALVTWAAVARFDISFTPDMVAQWEKDGITYIMNSRTNQLMPMKYQIVEDLRTNQGLVPSQAAKTISVPTLLIHGSEDETVPHDHTHLIQGNNAKIKVSTIEGANHVFGGGHPFNENHLPEHSRILVEKTVSFLQNI